MNNYSRLTLLLLLPLMVTSCASIKEKMQVNPNYATYAEPQEGLRARARLTGPGWKNVYPGTACNKGLYPGAGKPGGPRLGGGFAKLDLGMPKLGDTSRPLEIYLRADEPVMVEFYHGGTKGYSPCPPTALGQRSSCMGHLPTALPPCQQLQTFVPQEGKDYEVVYTYLDRQTCDIAVYEIGTVDDGSYRLEKIPSQPAYACPE